MNDGDNTYVSNTDTDDGYGRNVCSCKTMMMISQLIMLRTEVLVEEEEWKCKLFPHKIYFPPDNY